MVSSASAGRPVSANASARLASAEASVGSNASRRSRTSGRRISISSLSGAMEACGVAPVVGHGRQVVQSGGEDGHLGLRGSARELAGSLDGGDRCRFGVVQAPHAEERST